MCTQAVRLGGRDRSWITRWFLARKEVSQRQFETRTCPGEGRCHSVPSPVPRLGTRTNRVTGSGTKTQRSVVCACVPVASSGWGPSIDHAKVVPVVYPGNENLVCPAGPRCGSQPEERIFSKNPVISTRTRTRIRMHPSATHPTT